MDSTNTLRAASFDNVEVYNAADSFELRAYCMIDSVIAFDETSGLIRFVNYLLSNHTSVVLYLHIDSHPVTLDLN